MDIDHDNISFVDAMESRLTNAITAAIDAIAPVRSIRIRSKEKPWVTPDLLVMIKDRERMFKVASNLGTPALVAKFKSLRSQVCNKIDTKRTQYLASRLEQDPLAKARWRELRLMATLKSKRNDALIFFSPQELNEHFAAMVNRHPPLQLSELEDILTNCTYQPPPQLNFSFQLATINK